MPEQPLFKFVGQAVRDHADRRIGRPIEDKCVPIDQSFVVRRFGQEYA